MLNYKGKYYAKQILREITLIRDKLSELRIIKTSDLGEHTNLAVISASISTSFLSTELASVLVKSYSEFIKENFYIMGEENLSNLPEASKYYEELIKVYDSNSNNKGFEYFKLFSRYHYSVSKCLHEALMKAERFEGIPSRRKGSSFSFDTTVDNMTFLKTSREDYTKLGLRIPNSEEKFIQLDSRDVYRGKVSASASSSNSVSMPVIINIAYNDEKELAKKLYPVVSTYKNRPIDKVEMISGAELVSILKEYYGATVSNVIVDMEAFYEQADKVARQNLQEAAYFITGKHKAYRVIDCEKIGEWPIGVIKATSPADLGNVSLLTPKNFDIAMSKKNEKNLQAARRGSEL